MLLNFFALVVIFVVAKSHYSSGKALMLSAIIGVLTFVMYFLFNLIGIFIIASISSAPGLLHREERPSLTDVEDLRKLSKSSDSILPICAVITALLAWIIFSLLKISNFIEALFFLTFAMYSVLALLDRIFTHMKYRILPSAAEAVIYFVISLHFFHK